MQAEVLSAALFLAILANRLIEAIVAPIKNKVEIDWWFLIYVSWVFGGVLAWLAQINLFTEYFEVVIVGRILTAIVIGGGANLINDLFGKQGQ